MGIENWQNISIKADDSCPIATRDIAVNLKNRQNAIDTAGYGPLNPKKPNDEFWNAKAERWDVSPQEAQQQKCGNCAAFIKSERMLKCIDEGLGNESGNAAWDVIEAGELGYCEAFDFKCASARTCDAWIVGGPITEEKEKNMEEKSLDELFNELLEIEEKVAPIVPVVPMPSQRNIPGPKRPGQRPRIVAPGMANPNFRRGYKAVDEESYEDDEYAMYDDMYEGQNSRNKRIGGSPDTREARNNASLRAVGDFFGGRATPSGSPDTTEARGRSRVNNLGSVIARSLGPQIPGPVGDDRRASLRPNRGPGWGGTAPRPRSAGGLPKPTYRVTPSID
jgi:hypothetical protein